MIGPLPSKDGRLQCGHRNAIGCSRYAHLSGILSDQRTVYSFPGTRFASMGTAIAGILESLGATAIWESLRRSWGFGKRWRYSRIFGSDSTGGELFVAVAVLQPPQARDQGGNPTSFVFTKPGIPETLFSAAQVVSNCEVRSAKYLVESIAINAGRLSTITSDEEIINRQDLSFVSIGLGSNVKTRQLVANAANSLVMFDGDGFTSKASNRSLIRNVSPTEDHGLILKIHPSGNPERTWICCAGLGEWGTSGAAWYLANRWRDLKFGSAPFAVIVRVTIGQDESAISVVRGRTPAEIESFVR